MSPEEHEDSGCCADEPQLGELALDLAIEALARLHACSPSPSVVEALSDARHARDAYRTFATPPLDIDDFHVAKDATAEALRTLRGRTWLDADLGEQARAAGMIAARLCTVCGARWEFDSLPVADACPTCAGVL